MALHTPIRETDSWVPQYDCDFDIQSKCVFCGLCDWTTVGYLLNISTIKIQRSISVKFNSIVFTTETNADTDEPGYKTAKGTSYSFNTTERFIDNCKLSSMQHNFQKKAFSCGELLLSRACFTWSIVSRDQSSTQQTMIKQDRVYENRTNTNIQ